MQLLSRAGSLLVLAHLLAATQTANSAPPDPISSETQDNLVVTATRIPEQADRIPAEISVISGEELVTRGATDLATALSVVPGIEAPPGGDAGPSSAVPSFWGLHEFDAFLLVVDGVPWGGAFNPAITALHFNDVERVEVMKGAAPVMYGATSFVGVVQAIHYPAGDAAHEAALSLGTKGSVRGSASVALSQSGSYRQSLAIDGEHLGFSDSRESVANGQALYRGSRQFASGTLRVDADMTFVRDTPPSPALRTGATLSGVTPIDANFNPADARIDENRYHIAIGYAKPSSWGSWDTLASYAYSTVTDIRAFLHPDLTGTADSQHQSRHIDDAYLDTHITHTLLSHATMVLGADLLFGRGRQTTLNGNGAYTVPLDGSVVPPHSRVIPVSEIGTLNDRRIFAGQYAVFDWKAADRWDMSAGLRVNETYEHKDSGDLTVDPLQSAYAIVSKTEIRPTETIGASYRISAVGKDEAFLYADFRSSFKPAAVDFGPDYTPNLLRPESAQSYEAGVKGATLDGRVNYQAEFFLTNFNNVVVATSSGAQANAASEKLRGFEVEGRYEITADLTLAESASYHNATFAQYFLFDGTTSVDVSGRQLTLSPHFLGAIAALYTPAHGVTATVIARYVGRRFLDEENTAPVGSYITLDANLGYSWEKYSVTVDGTNLTSQRPPVTASEFGSQSFYLLPNRMLWVRARWAFR